MTVAKSTRQQYFDASCYDLAERALPSRAKYGMKAKLAGAIQECIEDWLHNHSVVIARELGEDWRSEL
jgi:hypothetical protein